MKNIIITGTSSGFGLVIAKTLAQQGNAVFATMRNVETKNSSIAASLRQWAAENSAILYVIELDATSDSSVRKAIKSIAAQTNGVIDVLINNAGVSFIGLNETLSAEQVDRIFQINVIAVDRMIKAVLPYMHLKKSGLLVTISSVGARLPTPIMGVYCASKAAVDSLSVSYYYELKSSGIDITILQPGTFQTTSIVAKQMVPDNPNAESYYDEDIINFKKNMFRFFEPTFLSPNPQRLADAISKLVQKSNGQRPLWTIVEGGPKALQIVDMNTVTRELVESILNAGGLQTH